MCGIAGFLDLKAQNSGEELGALAGRMAAALAHRGPDDAGVWVDAEAGVALGHRRLAVIDLSAEGHQPMLCACGRCVVVYNGEIYNYRALRAELSREGEQFRGQSDTEVLLAAVCRWGLERALSRLNGMFAFALWDRQARTLYLARDRLGEKPLYYGWVGHVFLFGSELKALRVHPAFTGSIDREAVALFLRHNYVPTPWSVYQGIRKLPSASWIAVSCDRRGQMPRPRPYWSVGAIVEQGLTRPFRGTASEAVEQLDSLLRDAVGLRMVADVPLGAFLSGGIDSSTIVALMQAQSDRPVRTFTIGFHQASYNEAEYAKAVARHLETDHTELYVTPREVLAVIPRLPALYDEPFADSSQIPTFLVAEMARQHVTVCLSGDGGDELFGGYNRYFWGRDCWRAMRWLPRGVRQLIAGVLMRLDAGRDSQLDRVASWVPSRWRVTNPGEKVRKLADVLEAGNPDVLYLMLVSHWRDPTVVVKGVSEPATILMDPSIRCRIPDFTLRMMYLDAVTYLPDDILVKVDRASMAVSLEARVPFLDHRVVEFAWHLPVDFRVRRRRGKWLLRQVLRRYVPDELIERPKMGFGAPIGEWLRGPLRDWAEALLDERKMVNEGLFDPVPIRRMWQEHLAGLRNWHYHLWDVLMFQAWLEAHGGSA